MPGESFWMILVGDDLLHAERGGSIIARPPNYFVFEQYASDEYVRVF